MKKIFFKKSILGLFLGLILAAYLFISYGPNINNKNNDSSLTASVSSALMDGSGSNLNFLTKLLRPGSRGDEVKILQEFLNNQGYIIGNADGVFGLKTRKALLEFQRDNGLKISGTVTEETKNFINEKIAQKAAEEEIVPDEIIENPEVLKDQIQNDNLNTNGTPPQIKKYTGPLITNELSSGDKSVNVAILQRFLDQSGYGLGGADGNFGSVTLTVLKSFQAKNNLSVSGNLDNKTREFINNLIEKGNFDFSTVEQDYNNQQQREEEDRKQKEEEAKQQALQKEKELTLDILDLNSNETLFGDYSCKEKSGNQKMTIFTGETIDETKDKRAVVALSDVWTTTDGETWKKEATTTAMGAGWERMVVNVDDTIYSFGGKYKGSGRDNGIYKTTDMVNWTYLGDLPTMSPSYDRSVVYFKDKFWLIGSEEGKQGVWSSSTGEKWTEELKNTPWSGYGGERRQNLWGYYDSNSLGAYVINEKMFYIVYNGRSSTQYGAPSIYSTTDGKNWKNEGVLSISNQSILPNINPQPVFFKDKIWIISSDPYTQKPLVINTSDGINWSIISGKDTKFYKETQWSPNPRHYASTLVFKDKIWSIGGWDIQNSGDANNDNGNDIWYSPDGINWTKVTPKGVSYPGPADRWLAGYASMGSYGTKASNLGIEREYNITSYLTGSLQKEVTLGQWKLSSISSSKNTGDIVINDLSFLGNDYRDYNNKTFSSLEYAQNIIIYADNVKIGEIKNFAGPFYDKDGLPVRQKITLDKAFTIKKDSSVLIKLVADFTAPNYLNFAMRTFLAGIGFKDEFSTPCNISSNDYSDGYKKFPGRNIYYKR